MADFLSREADILGGEFASSQNGGGLGDDLDFDRAASAFPDISLDEDGDIPFPPPLAGNTSTSGFSFDSFDAPRDNGNIKVTGDDELGKFESEFPDIQPEQHRSPPVNQLPTFGATFAPRPQPSNYSSTPILTQQIDEEEPQVIRDWREKQEEEIRKREEASKARRQETVSKAERAIDEFYEEYAKKKERNIRENKDHEAEFVARITSSLATGTTWERICELVELQNSQSKTIARTGAGTTDLTRFKEVLLRLKREGDSAPGAAGY